MAKAKVGKARFIVGKCYAESRWVQGKSRFICAENYRHPKRLSACCAVMARNAFSRSILPEAIPMSWDVGYCYQTTFAGVCAPKSIIDL